MATPKNSSVIKAFDILQRLAAAGRPLGVQEIARATDATLPTTHRFLLTLEELGAVSRSPGKGYQLGLLMAELGLHAGRDRILAERARVLVEALAEDLGETAGLTLFTGGEMRKVAWHEPARTLVCRDRGGAGDALHCTCAGKLYFASLPATLREETFATLPMAPLTPHSVRSIADLRGQIRTIRETGVAISREESEPGMIELGVPVPSGEGSWLGALTLAAPASRLDAASSERALAAMRRTVQAITSRMFVQSYTVPGKARPRGSFPHLKKAGAIVFVSGTSSRRPDDTFAGVTILPDGSVFHDVYEQTRETMLNIADILGSLSLGPDDIVSLEAFLIDIGDRTGFDAAIARSFDGAAPPMTVVPAKALPHPHQAIMIKAMARDA